MQLVRNKPIFLAAAILAVYQIFVSEYMKKPWRKMFPYFYPKFTLRKQTLTLFCTLKYTILVVWGQNLHKLRRKQLQKLSGIDISTHMDFIRKTNHY